MDAAHRRVNCAPVKPKRGRLVNGPHPDRQPVAGVVPNVSEQYKPRRTCIGCRKSEPQDQLLRWVAVTESGGNAVVPDPGRRRSGRGAWLHPSPECAALAVKRRAFGRALRAPVDAMTLEAALAAIGGSPHGGKANPTVQPESGSEN